MSSSSSLGTRELELALWNSIGVNIQTRSTWYLEGRGMSPAFSGRPAAWEPTF